MVTSRLLRRFIFNFMLFEGWLVMGVMVVGPRDFGTPIPSHFCITVTPALRVVAALVLPDTEVPALGPVVAVAPILLRFVESDEAPGFAVCMRELVSL